MKNGGITALVLAFTLMASSAFAANLNGKIVINDKGSAGACQAVTTGSVVTILAGKTDRGTVTLYATVGLNIEAGDPFGNAPSVTPTTGAIGTGAGFPIPATTLVTISGDRDIPAGQSAALSLAPGSRIDAIAQTANGNVCTWEQP